MGYKQKVAMLAAKVIAPSVYKAHLNAVKVQDNLLKNLIAKAADTDFGKANGFADIKSYSDYTKQVKICDYELLTNYIDLIADGKPNVLWKGLPMYFCKSSGTTSGIKYIPVTKEQIDEMIRAARNSLMMYVYETGKANFFDHKMIFLQGSPELEMHGKIPAGRLSGIVYHHVPFYVNTNRLPSYRVNCIEDWEEKVEAIAVETLKETMSLISGIPPWCVMYFERLLQLSGKQAIKEVFANFSVFAHGGVNYEPYRARIESLIGFRIDTIETYPASEGFIAYQDSQKETGLLLNINGGIFYEFVRADEIFSDKPKRLTLGEVEVGVQYAIILNTNAGLWSYTLGDTIKFVSTTPYRIVVTGRIKHFISAFGEHVIAEEVEAAMQDALKATGASVTEFTVAPQVTPAQGLPYHEWFIEFSKEPQDITHFARQLDVVLQQKNSYYKDLRQGNVLKAVVVTSLSPTTFIRLMKKQGKLGGQNKVPRLTNDRKLADALITMDV